MMAPRPVQLGLSFASVTEAQQHNERFCTATRRFVNLAISKGLGFRLVGDRTESKAC